MIHVTLLTHTPDPVRTVAAAAKLCYSKSDIASVSEAMSGPDAEKFVRMLAEMGHESPLEHASFTFGIEGVSRTFLAQMTRHRIASYSVQSQRYVEKSDFALDYVTPPEIARDPQAAKEFKRCMAECEKSYRRLSDILTPVRERELIEAGMSEREAAAKARKLAIEDARFVLPGACGTRLVATLNARSLRGFFSQRCCMRAQWEIRAAADEMFRLCYEAAPALFASCGPGCLGGKCPEGGMSCGQAAAVRARFKRLRGEG